MKIAVDFDGTVVEHRYPHVGKDVPHAVAVLKELNEHGHQLILYTMRSGLQLQEAVAWFEERGIELYSIQKDKGQERWSSSNKCYAQIYIDDAALGCPLVYPADGSRPYVNWRSVVIQLRRLTNDITLYGKKEAEDIKKLQEGVNETD